METYIWYDKNHFTFVYKNIVSRDRNLYNMTNIILDLYEFANYLWQETKIILHMCQSIYNVDCLKLIVAKVVYK